MISVVVPIYNTEKYLKQCVDSILNQTYHDLDVILVDDGSTDSCGLICDEYDLLDSRVRTYHIDNIGISGARNFGINKAREMGSKYIYFADSDDWLDLNMLEALYDAAEKHGADIAVCGAASEFLDGFDLFVEKDKEYNHAETVKYRLDGSFLHVVWNKLWSIKLFDEIEFPIGRYFEDVVTTYLLFEKAEKAVSVSSTIYHYRMRCGSIVHTSDLPRLLDWWHAAEKLYTFFDEGAYSNDKSIRSKRLRYCANAAINIWAYLPKCSTFDLNNAASECETIAYFARTNFTTREMREWMFPLKCVSYLLRRNNKFNYLIVYLLKRIYKVFKKHRKLFE